MRRRRRAARPTRASRAAWSSPAVAGTASPRQDRRRTATRCCPPGVPVLSVEAATTFGWERYADDSIGIDRFGASAPGDVVLDKLGINVEHVVGAGPRPA